MYKALKSFSGNVSMTAGEVRDFSDDSIVKDLLRAGYIKEINPAKVEAEPKEEEPKKAKPKAKKRG